MVKHDCIVIMGAAVKPDGTPSGALSRRVSSAITISLTKPDSFFIVTGGFGKSKLSEAEVMKRLLMDSGILQNNIITDERSTDTLSSVLTCTEILRQKSYNRLYVCSDTYHIPRCRWLFLVFGISTAFESVQSGLKANGILKWCYYYVREAAALPYDTILLLLHKLGMPTIKK